MGYIYVAGGGTDVAMEQAITRQTKFALYSLIGGLRQQDFGLDTLEKVACDIREFARLFTVPVGGKIVTDSGGYSFIKGDIPPSKILMLVDCYTVYLESELEEYDRIFSLDIPFSLKYESFNTVAKILQANTDSLCASRSVLERHEALQNKFFFVWHFKMQEQFAIWKHLYAELGMEKFVRNHAIGGMVGLKEATNISFTPFTGMSYYILYRHMQGPHAGDGLKIHYLGVYAPSDRFHIVFLEKLFRGYFGGAADVQTSYDSINPIHTVRMNADVPLYVAQGADFQIYPSLLDAPQDILRGIAADDSHYQVLLSEMDRRRNGVRLQNAAAFSPLNVFSNLQLDEFFGMVIDQYDLIGELGKATSPTNLKGRLTRIFKDIAQKYPKAFSPHMEKTITITLERTWFWHKWFVDRRDEATLEEYMVRTIKDIGFPCHLK
ncbi:hypothetical protein G3N56_16295 [Desulfovibrio sulfodismutans]|uniref:Uncharacterized protein n=1 Tax=Desulfolutivibrio sulfodismutans TaxID=63561 RepID=A0A7K3NQ22_9BACT|nr:hypothetical protein [Desulfolutivibrio sulfodismutans]NDY58294.1 hypothetical protein [Desulfolutivibrio sulfodismutans]QLA12637.1 hypothetical protein GD606_10315 [Desulfolutivibrio sulfodismutans DSM 3696]